MRSCRTWLPPSAVDGAPAAASFPPPLLCHLSPLPSFRLSFLYLFTLSLRSLWPPLGTSWLCCVRLGASFQLFPPLFLCSLYLPHPLFPPIPFVVVALVLNTISSSPVSLVFFSLVFTQTHAVGRHGQEGSTSHSLWACPHFHPTRHRCKPDPSVPPPAQGSGTMQNGLIAHLRFCWYEPQNRPHLEKAQTSAHTGWPQQPRSRMDVLPGRWDSQAQWLCRLPALPVTALPRPPQQALGILSPGSAPAVLLAPPGSCSALGL